MNYFSPILSKRPEASLNHSDLYFMRHQSQTILRLKLVKKQFGGLAKTTYIVGSLAKKGPSYSQAIVIDQPMWESVFLDHLRIVHSVWWAWEQTNRPSQKCATFYTPLFFLDRDDLWQWSMHATAPGIPLWLDWCPGGAVLLPSIILRPQKMRSNVSFVCGPPSNPCMKYAFFISSIIDNKEDPSMLENSVQHCKKTRQSQDLHRNEEALESAAMQRAKKSAWWCIVYSSGFSEVAHNLDGYILGSGVRRLLGRELSVNDRQIMFWIQSL